MKLWRKLKYLLPSYRRTEEREMQEELKSLQAMAGPRELGNLTLAAESARDVWTWTWLERLGQDLRYSWRAIIHNKAFTAMAVLSLALGIGANTAIYSFMDSILLRPLPVSNPESLLVMKWQAKRFTLASKGFSMSTGGTDFDVTQGKLLASQFPYPALKLFQDSSDILSSAFCYFGADHLDVTIREETEAVKGHYVSGNYFRGMGAPATAGRLILPSDDNETAPPIAILSYRFAQRRFGDPGRAVGQSIRINDTPVTVAGVTSSEFFGAEPGSVPDIYLPIHDMPLFQPAIVVATAEQQYLDSNYYWIEIMGRLKPGVSIAQAQAALAPQFQHFAEASASTDAERADLPALVLQPGISGLDSLRRKYSKPLYVLMAMVGLILAIACVNVANLLLARATSRRHEIAVRLSIGASRLRVMRQLLTESVLLSSIGGALGIAFAWWGIRILTLILANGRENFTLHAEMNWHVLGVTFGLSILTGVLFGLAPAIQATRVDVLPKLNEDRARRTSGRTGMGRILVVTQIAFSLLLLVAAGLFGRTLSNLHSIDTGFNRENVLLFSVSPRAAGYQGPALDRLYEDLREQLRQIPDVRNVSLSTSPLPTGGGSGVQVTVPGGDPALGGAGVFSVGPAFFETMQIPLALGREFGERDSDGAPPVAVVNKQFAKAFGLKNPVGRTFSTRGGKNTYEIIGMVGDAIYIQLKGTPQPMLYFPYLQNSTPPGAMTFEVRTSGNPLDQANAVRSVLHNVDSRLAAFNLETQSQHIDQAISTEIALARLCSVFAGLALVIACVGLYGTVAFNVARRTSEIGIRMALGAQRNGIVWMVLREVLVLAILGLAIGVPAALAGSRYVKSFLYGIQPNDPLTIILAVVVLLTAGLIAGYLPAKRAARIDPLTAIRHD